MDIKKQATAREFSNAATTWTGTFSDLQASADFIAVQVQGVSTVHRLYALVGANHTTYVYIVVPDGGPYGALHSFATTPRTLQAWEVPFGRDAMPLMLRVHLHVVMEAMAEVDDEYSF